MSSAECTREVRSAGCEGCTVKCEESVRLALHCAGVVRRSCSWTTSQDALHQLMTRAPARSDRQVCSSTEDHVVCKNTSTVRR